MQDGVERAAIEAAHPMRTGRHDLYTAAMRLVGGRHSKGDIVELVNWLLFREAAAWAAGAEAMREMAGASADCGCDVRAIVLERLASRGLREAERCCGQHYDACCALTAAAIRALPIPPMPNDTNKRNP